MILDNDYDQLNRVKTLYHWVDKDRNGKRDQSEIRAQFEYALRADGKRTAAIEQFWRETSPTSTEMVTQNEFDWSYDAVDRLISETLSHNSIQEYRQDWQYDLSGNRTSQTNGSESTTYVYDANDRLTLSTKTVNATIVETETYTYNKTQQATKVDVTPNVTTSQTYTYTLQGALRSVLTTKDLGGQNTTASTIVYEYDSTGTRVASVLTENSGVTRTEYLTDSQNPTGYSQVIQETVLNATGQLIKRTSYSIGHDQISQAGEEWVEVDADGNPAHWEYATHYFGTDGHGSVRVLYDAMATIARDRLNLQQLYSYDAYGNLLNWSSRPATVYLHNGESFDFTIGQQYLRARFYDPITGRFTGFDSFSGNANDPQSYHKYLYVHGDPVNLGDPTGEFAQLFLAARKAAADLATYASLQAQIVQIHALSALRIYLNLGLSAGGVVGKVLNYSWLVGSASSFWTAHTALNGLRYKLSNASESFATAANRLQRHLESTQTTADGREQARRIAMAIKYTYEKNSRFHFRAIDPTGLVEVSLQKGIFCAEWATAFRNAATFELRNSATPAFSVEREFAAKVGDEDGHVHSWLKITPLNGGQPIFVDDAFGESGLFVHNAPPIPRRYSADASLNDVFEAGWFPPPIYDSSGRWIDDSTLNPWIPK